MKKVSLNGLQGPMDAEFVKRATEQVVAHLNDKNFSGNALATLLHLSREQTHRKLKKNLSVSTGKFIRNIRMLKAYNSLRNTDLTISEISYEVGYESPAYFNKCFKETFGCSPGEVRKYGNGVTPAIRRIQNFYLQPPVQQVLNKNNISPDWKNILNKRVRKKHLLLYFVIPLLMLIVVSGFFYWKKLTEPVFKENSRIAVIPFTNETGDGEMDQVGDIAGSWISSQLDNLEGIKSVPYFTVKEYQPYLGILPDDVENRPTFGEVVDASFFIAGSYFIINNEIYFDVDLMDGYTQESVYHLPLVKGSSDSIMSVIENLRQDIAGLLTNIDEVKIGKLSPPNFEAYKNYVKGLSELKVGMYPSQAQQYFEKSARLDSEFVMPRIFLTWYYRGPTRDSIVEKIGQIKGKTDYEEGLYTELNYLFQRKYHESLDVGLIFLEDYPRDYYFNMLVGHRAKSLFMPELSLKVLSRLQDPLESNLGLVWYYFKTRNYVESLLMLDRNEEALKYLNSIKPEFSNRAVPTLLISTYVALGWQREQVDHYIDDFRDEKDLFAEYLIQAAWEYTLVFDTVSSVYFAAKAIPVLDQLPENRAGYYDLVDALYLTTDMDRTESYLKEKLAHDPENNDFRIYLANVEASMGHPDELKDILTEFDNTNLIYWRRHEFEYQSDYLKARIYALLNNKEESVKLLQQALEKGQLRHYWDFDRDIFLRSLFGYPPFLDMVKPVG